MTLADASANSPAALRPVADVVHGEVQMRVDADRLPHGCVLYAAIDSAVQPEDVLRRCARDLVEAMAKDWKWMTPEARLYFTQELLKQLTYIGAQESRDRRDVRLIMALEKELGCSPDRQVAQRILSAVDGKQHG